MNVTDEVCRARCDAARYAGEVKGRADERAAVVAWLRKNRGDGSKMVGYTEVIDAVANGIERGEYEVKKPDQCMDCGTVIIGAHGCQGRPGDEES